MGTLMLGASRANLVLRPSPQAYVTKWLRNIRLWPIALTLLVVFARSARDPGSAGVVACALALLSVVGLVFFSRAEIVLGRDSLSYRRFLVRREFPLARVGG